MDFCGQEKCLIDHNGRIKLPPRMVRAFKSYGDQVILHCLNEGALGLYPLSTWTEMRQADAKPSAEAARSVVYRRQLRRYGAFTQQQHLTNQGRLTIPVLFRPYTALEPGTEAYVVGCELGLEIWNEDKWRQELEILQEHEEQKADAEMSADLLSEQRNIDKQEG